MDYSFEDYSKYRQYLNTIDIALNGYFEEQKDYIFCKKGCGHCCEKGQYPYSELEAKFLLLGFFKIPMHEQQKIIQNIIKTKEEYAKAENKKNFSYACPFLNEEKIAKAEKLLHPDSGLSVETIKEELVNHEALQGLDPNAGVEIVTMPELDDLMELMAMDENGNSTCTAEGVLKIGDATLTIDVTLLSDAKGMGISSYSITRE